MAEGMVISKAPSRLRPKAMKSAAMKPLTQGLEPSVTMPKGPRIAVVASPSAGEEDDDSEAEDERLHDALPAAAGLAVEEVGHRDRDHGEDARREDGGEAEAEGHGEEADQALRRARGGCAGRRGRWRFRVTGGDDDGGAGGRVDGEGDGAVPFRGNAHLGIADLVARGEGEFGGAGGCVGLQLRHRAGRRHRLRRSRYRN